MRALLGKTMSIFFDGGPTMTARTDQIRSIREAKDATVASISDALGDHKKGDKKLITVGRLHKFAAAYGWIDDHGDEVVIDEGSARALRISAGDEITYVERS